MRFRIEIFKYRPVGVMHIFLAESAEESKLSFLLPMEQKALEIIAVNID